MSQKKAEEIYRDLKEHEKIIGEIGFLSFKLKGISTGLESKDVVGSIIQDWMRKWLESRKIEFETNSNTQESPDFYLNIHNKKKDLLEIKAYDIKRGPGFDIGNFDAYCRSLKTQSYKLDADYLIFGYSKKEEGKIKIENLCLKKYGKFLAPQRSIQ